MAGRHIQTVIEEGQFLKLKVLALQAGIPLRDLLREIVITYLQSVSVNKEKHNG